MNHNEFLVSKYAFAENGYIWMLTEQTEILCCIDIQRRKPITYLVIPGIRTEDNSDMIMKNTRDSVFFSSCNDMRLFKFEKNKHVFINIFDTIGIKGKLKRGCYELIGAYADCLVFFLKESESIVYFDVNTGNMFEDIEVFSELKKNGVEINEHIFSESFFQDDDKLYIPINEQNFIMMINISKQSYNIYQLSNDINFKLITIDKDTLNGDFLLTTKENQGIVWNPDEGIKRVMEFKNTNQNNVYRDAFSVNGHNYYIPAYKRNIYAEVSDELKEMKFDFPDVEGKFRENVFEQYRACFKYENYVFFQARTNGQMYFIDTENNLIQEYNVEITHEEKANYIVGSYREHKKPDFYTEEYDFALSDYLGFMSE